MFYCILSSIKGAYGIWKINGCSQSSEKIFFILYENLSIPYFWITAKLFNPFFSIICISITKLGNIFGSVCTFLCTKIVLETLLNFLNNWLLRAAYWLIYTNLLDRFFLITILLWPNLIQPLLRVYTFYTYLLVRDL